MTIEAVLVRLGTASGDNCLFCTKAFYQLDPFFCFLKLLLMRNHNRVNKSILFLSDQSRGHLCDTLIL